MNKKLYQNEETEVMSTTTTGNDELTDHRVSTFEGLGFSKKDSKALAEAKHIDVINGKFYSFPLSWHKVNKMLEAGCTHELALKILL